MSFTSISYLFFLPLVWGLYWLLRKHLRWQNALLLAASYIFYGWLNWHIVPLFFFVSLVAFLSGIATSNYQGRKRTAIAVGSSVIITANLIIFKYYNFFTESIVQVLDNIGIRCDMPTIHLILPIGISFYTFQALGYIFDVYAGKQKPTKDLLSFLTFISFFPQLVAGPIERAKDLLPQIERKRSVGYNTLKDGTKQLIWGLFKKMVIADNCAFAVNEIWENYTQLSGITLTVGAILFSFQIYCDFSGYSDIAIGTAKLFGIRLSQNFNYPYFATSVADFWRRWNMTLMSWFRDYIYIPLGGNRCSKIKNIRNTCTVFLISGLWHGANWTFILWGAYHAIMMIPHVLLRGIKKKVVIPRWLKIAATFCIVTFGWILFRAPSISDAYGYISNLGFQGSLLHGKTALLYCLIFIIMDFIVKKRSCPAIQKIFRLKYFEWITYYIAIMAIVLFRGQSINFIYFQF